ncbi:hypothetical protein HDG34_003223 [Paraburkholderia sp. HC6.4b]|uniref:hypothetical protein n=1 Tax=unclassified Paraburkholderia TaxID=2615204 RepID=UPI001621EDBC|nr:MULTISPECIES: hypothetical protein [unclassified Paraburkholderia]MBB5409282.1 hypothetical protein [Paraburkholderia sp. HC6.4b]MBB5451010.1 hypothetical protein [Paraburkholderia sp. Kb1A]
MKSSHENAMKDGTNFATVLIFLDCLLDTRLGTLARMSDTLACRALSASYHQREEDVFEGVDTAEFRQMYRARDVETLKRSTITTLTTLLGDFSRTLSRIVGTRPWLDGVRILVNTWPYRLDAPTLDALQGVIALWSGGSSPVEMVDYAPGQLTPAFVKANFDILFMYEYEEWLHMHGEAFSKTSLADINVIVPALYFNHRPDEKTFDELVRDGAHPFAAITMLTSGFVGLELIDVKYFSIAEPAGIPAA